MGGLAQTPLPTVQNDLDLFWPNNSAAHVLGDPWDANFSDRYTGAQRSIWGAKVGGGTGNIGIDATRQLVHQCASSPLGQAAAFTATGVQFRPRLLRGGPSTTYKDPSYVRVFRVQLVLQLQALTAPLSDRNVFVGFIPNGGAGPDAAGASYFGVQLTPALRWGAVTRTGGILFGYSYQQDLFAAATTPHMLDFVMLEATGGADAVFQIYQDGQYNSPVVSLNWGPGTVLPDYLATVVNATSWQFRVQTNEPGAVVVLQLYGVRFSIGQFLPNGTPVT